MKHPEEPRILKLVDFDAMFAQTDDAILLNKIDYTEPDYSIKLNSKIYSRSGELNFVVSCDCGDLSGNFYLGAKCPKCNSTVKSDFSADSPLINDVWIGFPKEIPGVLHPIAYKILSKWLSYSKQNMNYIDAIINPKIDLPADLQGIILGRGHQYFYDNFDFLMNYFMTDHKKTSKKVSVPYIREFLKEWRHLIFCRHVPILSNVLHTMTSDGGKASRRYAEKSSEFVQKAAIDLSHLEFSSSRHRTSADFEAVIHTAYKNYITYVKCVEERLAGKESLIRKHIFGVRFHFSFRSVVVPIVGPHRYYELHLPWSLCVNLLRIHIIGRLLQQYDMDYPDAVDKQMRAVVNYDETVHQIIKDLISESPNKGLPVLFNRNPTLKRGSIQLLRVTKVKPNPHDETIGISVLVLKDSNTDFDGDALNGVLIIEKDAVREFEVLHPANRYVNPNGANVSDTITLPNQSFLIANSFLGMV